MKYPIVLIMSFLLLFVASCSTCHLLALPPQTLTGSDGACQAAGMFILQYMKKHNARCVYITNEGFIPSATKKVTRKQAEILSEGY